MSLFAPLNRKLKSLLRLPIRQSLVYVTCFRDGTLFDRSSIEPGTRKENRQTSARAVLVLDDGLPTPDREAGSRTVFEHVLCLRDLGHEVHFWPSNGLDVPKYRRALQRAGVRVWAGYFRPSLKAWLATRRGELEAALLNRPFVARATLADLRSARLPVVYYGHDLHFARIGMEAEKYDDAGLAAEAVDMKELETAIWRDVDVVTYPTSEETAVVAGLAPAAVARPLLAFCYDAFTERTSAPAGATIMFVGSFRHPPNVLAAVRLAREIFPLVKRDVPQARLVIVGFQPTAEIEALAGPDVEVAGWLSDDDLAALYERSRAAAIPMDVGAGIKLKVVEALAKGLPLATTPVGAQGLDGLDAIAPVCDDTDGFAAALVEILGSDDETWLARSRQQVRYARERFSRDAMKRSLSEALSLAPSHRTSR